MRLQLRTWRVLVVAALLALAVLPWASTASAVPTCDTSWANPADGFWDDARNWSNGVPDSTDDARDDACITVDGTYTVTIRDQFANADGITLGSSSGQIRTLKLEGGCCADATLTLHDQGGDGSEGIRRDGVLALESMGSGHRAAKLDIQGGSLTNAGVISTDDDGDTRRYLFGDLVNTGTMTLNRETYQTRSDSDWTNSGTIVIGANGSLLLLSGDDLSSFTMTGGTLTNNGVFRQGSGQFEISGGVATGNPLVLYRLSGLSPSGGTATLKLTGSANNALDSDIGAGITLVLEGGDGENANLFLFESRTNAGTIKLESGNCCSYNVFIDAPAVLTNTGTIETNVAGGNTPEIRGDLVNSGTMTLNRELRAGQVDSDWTNTGTIQINPGAWLNFLGGDDLSSFTMTAGSLINNGDFWQRSGQFSISGGTATGNPLLLASLDHEGGLSPSGGTATLRIFDSAFNELDSNIGPGITLLLAGDDLARLYVTEPRANAGTIRLGGSHLFIASAAALTNTGTIETDGLPGTRSVQGTLVNAGTMTLNHVTRASQGDNDWTNTGTITIGATGELILGNIFFDESSFTMTAGTLTNNGLFRQSGGQFSISGGTATGNPIELETLDNEGGLSPSGGTATLRIIDAANELESDIGAGIKLVLNGLSSRARLVLTDSRTNAGTIKLESSFHSSGIGMFAGAVLTNSGTIQTNPGGTDPGRSISGDVVNNGLMDLNQDTDGAGQWTNNDRLDIAKNVTLRHVGSLTLGDNGVLKIAIDSDTVFSRIDGGTLSFDGDLSIKRKANFKPLDATPFLVMRCSSCTGAFDKLINATITGARYFRPDYFETNFELIVTVASLTLTPNGGAPGTPFRIDGAGYPAGDTVTLKFKDSSGTSFGLGQATTDENGAFFTFKNVPANADPGNAKVSGKSLLTAVTPKANFQVS